MGPVGPHWDEQGDDADEWNQNVDPTSGPKSIENSYMFCNQWFAFWVCYGFSDMV